MTDLTPHLALPILRSGQAQKHVTLNEGLFVLDAVVQLQVTSRTLSAPPAEPVEGVRYLMPAGTLSGSWSAYAAGTIAWFNAGAWVGLEPQSGWRLWVEAEAAMLVFDGEAWRPLPGPTDGPLTLTDELRLAGEDGRLVFAAPGAGGYREMVFRDSGDVTRFSLGYGEGAGLFVNRLDATGAYVDTPMLITPGGRLASTGGFTVWRGGANNRPEGDNQYPLGAPFDRLTTVYASTGAINTSDALEKHDCGAPPAALLRALRAVLSSVHVFQWLDAVAEKGPDRARLHLGVTAQTVRDAWRPRGSIPTAGVCSAVTSIPTPARSASACASISSPWPCWRRLSRSGA